MKTTYFIVCMAIALFQNSHAQPYKTTPAMSQSLEQTGNTTLYPALLSYFRTLEASLEAIAEPRKSALNQIAQYIEKKINAGEDANLTFICTHNSRRSHMSQIWAKAAAFYLGISQHIHTYSGGTEATAFNPRAVAAIERSGFQIVNPGGENPRYQVNVSENSSSMICFSKTYNDPYNPASDFAAVMTCSDADQNCPIISGADLRVSLPFVDPKLSDGTAKESETYDERCRQIATEMLYVMSRVKSSE